MNKIVIAVCVGALLVPAATALGQIKQSKGTYLLRMKFTAGKVRKYPVSSKVSGLPVSAVTGPNGVNSFGGPFIETVKSLSGKTAKVTFEIGPFSINGQKMHTGAEAQKTTVQIDELGNVVGQASASFFGVHYPKAPVMIGGTWSSLMALPATVGGSGESEYTFKFNGVKTVGKQKVGDISLNMQPTGMVTSGVGKALVSAADGSLVKMSMNLSLANPQGSGELKVAILIQAAK